MNRIIINEQDLTYNNIDATFENTVYVPGFAGVDATVGPNVPTLCTTLGEFYNAFGRTAPTFTSDQLYPVYNAGSTTEPVVAATPGFPEDAIPYESDGDAEPEVPVMYANNTTDPSYVYAVQLLLRGIPIVYERMNLVTDSTAQNYDVTVANAYKYLSKIYVVDDSSRTTYPAIFDKSEYDILFLTSGGYPASEYRYVADAEAGTSDARLDALMNYCAEYRGDCIAVIDHTNNPHRPLEGTGSVYEASNVRSSYSVMFTPWCNVNTVATPMPPSYVYFCTLQTSLQSNPLWAAVAGVSRGLTTVVDSLNTDLPLTNRIAESYQNDYRNTSSEGNHSNLNPVTYIRPYGYTIWGNRTSQQYVVGQKNFATSFLNTRILVSQVKKQAYMSARQCMFEVNNDILWTNFKASMATLLDQMVTSNGLEQYKLLKIQSVDKTKLKCQIILYPTYNVESVEISVILTDEDLEVEDTIQE